MQPQSSVTDPDNIVLAEHPSDAVRVIRLNRPHVLNALSREMVARVNQELDAAAADGQCRVVILAAAGRGFCSGQDMAAANSRNEAGGAGVVEKLHWQEQYAGMAARIRAMPQPVIAVINGAAVGAGMGIALAADIRIVSPAARFLVAAVRIGLSAGESGISYHLPRLIGAGRAFEILLTGRPVGAAEACDIGLAVSMVETDKLESTALEYARAIIANSPFSVRQTKRLMWANLDADSLDEALALENSIQILASMTDDYKEATAAYMAKRSPLYKGR